MANVVLVAGLGFGDEGKGSIVDWLTRTRKAHTVVRYNGGAQAAHNVMTDDGQHYVFAQFGSGTLAGARTHLSRYMLVNPISFMAEELELRKYVQSTYAFDLVTIERGALVTTPYHVLANRYREGVRGDGRHGSCGMGVGETMSDSLDAPDDAIRIGDLEDLDELRRKLTLCQERKVEEMQRLCPPEGDAQMERMAALQDRYLLNQTLERFRYFAKQVRFVEPVFLDGVLNGDGTVIFEGAQGVLLDQDYGFHPYTTWTDTTFGNAHKLLQHFKDKPAKIGVLRAYGTRHGPGPFPTEDPELVRPDEHNGFGEWQRDFRVGHFDLVLGMYASKVVGGVDSLALTCLDRFEDGEKIPYSYAYEIPGPDDLPQRVDPLDGAPAGQSEEELKARFKVTQLLSRVKPVYDAAPQDIFMEVAGAVAPVGIRSRGPRPKDKT